jgi:hypothetical protein
MRIQKGIASRERNLSPYVAIFAECAQVVQNPNPLIELKGRSIATVVTVLAVEIARLGNVPLKGEDR